MWKTGLRRVDSLSDVCISDILVGFKSSKHDPEEITHIFLVTDRNHEKQELICHMLNSDGTIGDMCFSHELFMVWHEKQAEYPEGRLFRLIGER